MILQCDVFDPEALGLDRTTENTFKMTEITPKGRFSLRFFGTAGWQKKTLKLTEITTKGMLSLHFFGMINLRDISCPS